MDDQIYVNFERLSDGSLRFKDDYSGRGPRKIHRPDERLYEDICELLMADPDIDADEIEVDVKDSLVTLTGTVETKRLKRYAEEVIADIPGVEDVQNHLKLLHRENYQ